MRTIRHAGLIVLAVLMFGCVKQRPEVAQAESLLASIRSAGLVPDALGAVEIVAPRQVRPLPTRWVPSGPSFWWTELRCAKGSAGYLAWTEEGRLIDFSVEGLREVISPQALALAGVPPIQQFPIKSSDGSLVASGCVPTAGASLIAFWSTRPAAAAWGGAGEQDLVRRLRARMPMAVIPDVEGYADGKMSLAGAMPSALADAMQADADERGIDVGLSISGYDWKLLSAELSAGRPVLIACVVLLPRKPELNWGHEVVAVGRAEIGGAHYVGVIDNFYAPRIPGTLRWIAEDCIVECVLVRPRR